MLKDLVHQTSTTTGTGTYTLTGSVTGRRAFTAFADGDVIPCTVADGAGGFESGWYTVGGTGTTLARTEVLESSNANAAVNWAAGTRQIYANTHASAGLSVRHTIDAAGTPTATDDDTKGYGIGSIWTGPGVDFPYICKDASTGAAAWLRHIAIDFDNSTEIDLVFGSIGDEGEVTVGNSDAAEGATADASFLIGNEQATDFHIHRQDLLFAVQTEDDTPSLMMGTNAIDGISFDATTFAHATMAITGDLIAMTLDGSASKKWTVDIHAKMTSGVITIDNAVFTGISDYGTVTGWTPAADDGANKIEIEVTGAAATVIGWAFNVRTTFIGVLGGE
jgi:hypothetical protein